MDRGTISLGVAALAVVPQAVVLAVLAVEALVAEVPVARGNSGSKYCKNDLTKRKGRSLIL